MLKSSPFRVFDSHLRFISSRPIISRYSTSTDPLSDFKELKWKPEQNFKLSFYKDLSKAKLASFVVLSTMTGYALAPSLFVASTFIYTSVGTGLCISAANTFNQWIEVPYDQQMSRTRNRVLPRHALSPTHVFTFGLASMLSGTMILYFINPICAVLGFGNIILYSCVYTPLKRVSIYNTWVGAVVGGIPPIIGWVAATSTIDMGSILLALTLFSWQFPHFNSLSWNLRADYSKAGYRMMSVLDPKLNAQVAVRHCLYMFPISYGFYHFGIVDWYFLVDSSLLNLSFLYPSYLFWRNSNGKTARKLFLVSLIHLPLILILLLLHKRNSAVQNEQNAEVGEQALIEYKSTLE